MSTETEQRATCMHSLISYVRILRPRPRPHLKGERTLISNICDENEELRDLRRSGTEGTLQCPSRCWDPMGTCFSVVLATPHLILFCSLRGRRRPRVRGDGVVFVVSVRRHLREGHLHADEGFRGRGCGGRQGVRSADDPEGDVRGRRGSGLSRSVCSQQLA